MKAPFPKSSLAQPAASAADLKIQQVLQTWKFSVFVIASLTLLSCPVSLPQELGFWKSLSEWTPDDSSDLDSKLNSAAFICSKSLNKLCGDNWIEARELNISMPNCQSARLLPIITIHYLFSFNIWFIYFCNSWFICFCIINLFLYLSLPCLFPLKITSLCPAFEAVLY